MRPCNTGSGGGIGAATAVGSGGVQAGGKTSSPDGGIGGAAAPGVTPGVTPAGVQGGGGSVDCCCLFEWACSIFRG